MKKIFTLLLAAGTVLSATAQHNGNYKNSTADRNDDKNQRSSDYHFNGADSKTVNYGPTAFSFREKEQELRRINQWYDQQITAVNRKRYLPAREKKQQIRSLETQRMAAIREAQFRYEQQLKRATARIPDNHHDRKW